MRQLTRCQKPDRQGGPVSKVALPDGRASDTEILKPIFRFVRVSWCDFVDRISALKNGE